MRVWEVVGEAVEVEEMRLEDWRRLRGDGEREGMKSFCEALR